jgi:dihydroneopterin aldolase
MNKATMYVRGRDLPLLADIGINPDEIGRRQPLVIPVDLQIGEARINEIQQTVDYRQIVRVADDLSQIRFPLIETFAQELGDLLLEMEDV